MNYTIGHPKSVSKEQSSAMNRNKKGKENYQNDVYMSNKTGHFI